MNIINCSASLLPRFYLVVMFGFRILKAKKGTRNGYCSAEGTSLLILELAVLLSSVGLLAAVLVSRLAVFHHW